MKTGGHIQRCNVGSVEDHNERKQEYLDRMERSGHPLNYFPQLTPTNQHWVNEEKHYKGKTVAEIFQLQQKWYFIKKKQKPQLEDRPRINKKTGKVETVAGWSPVREMIVITKPDTKIEDFEKVNAWFRANGVTPIRTDIHKDEGHVDEQTGERKINNHAHMVLDWMDWQTGSTVKLGKKKMSELQTVLADALGMERGELKLVTGSEHLSVVEYRTKVKHEELRQVTAAVDEKKQELLDLESATLWEKLTKTSKFDKAVATVTAELKDEYQDIIDQVIEDAAHTEQQLRSDLAQLQGKFDVQVSLNHRKSDTIKQLQDSSKEQQSTIQQLNTSVSALKNENVSLKKRLTAMEKVERAMRDCCKWAADCARGRAVWQWVYEKFEALCDAKGISAEWKNGRHSVAGDVWLATVDPDNGSRAYGQFTEKQQQALSDELHKAADHPELGRGQGIHY